MIQKTKIMQCSKDAIPSHVVEQIRKLSAGWGYESFDDDSMIQYLVDNPIPEFPNIIEKISAYERGAHKVDLFRYYYLYINGGIFIDSDLAIVEKISKILKDYDFVSILADSQNNQVQNSSMVMNGFLACNKNDPIIYDALVDAYNLDPSPEYLRDDTLGICRNLYKIYEKHKNSYSTYLYMESVYAHHIATVSEGQGDLVAIHYYGDKVIPTEIPLYHKTNSERLAELFSIYESPNTNYKRFGSYLDGGYVHVDDIESTDSIISFGVSYNIDYEAELSDIGCEVFAFDNSIESLPWKFPPQNIIFENATIGPDKTISDVLSLVDKDKDLILKMDIEGAEWDVLKQCSKDDMLRFRQVVIEFHDLVDISKSDERTALSFEVISRLLRTHLPVLIFPNNHGRFEIVDSVAIPDVIEVLFLRKSTYSMQLIGSTIKPLRHPNCPSVRDIKLFPIS
jgi:hypothetical protein